ncbi:TetR/AcrR family transcriptional regulator [Nonomuraea sp. PA05]|uniref:TetR/AcrR family transcriptional regulator n=1 Tax=Nonomuraea sp. PA05 TaxID=2604466 RepID=UPI0011D913C5|nr:TetR/AcrR family transcriptional regulator [Nonomuraea sp. PA05]TYB45975.1 TetR/AcrR family transcriptional regulator [Nonomuraea sp. PA05]
MPRAVSTSKELGALRHNLLDAAMRVLREQGAPYLTLRRVADAAATSTMGIYTCFGGRAGLLEAIYEHGSRLLHEAMTNSLNGHTDPLSRIMAVGYGYRQFALSDPALYALMFERPLPDFDPSPERRTDALRRCFGLLVEATTAAAATGAIHSTNPERSAYLVWTTIHGLVSIELTCSLRTPLPGWFLNSKEEGERILADGLRALLSGLT